MIKIEITEFDFDVIVETLNTIPFNSPGVYLLYDKDGSLKYVGKATDLRKRVTTHFRGSTNTSQYIWSIHRCKAFIEKKRAYRSIYELFLIDELQPPLNILSNSKEYQGQKFSLNKADPNKLNPTFCKFNIKEGRQCSKPPLSNGYCYLHGGAI
ncbi:MAG: GIY-YIG nuclease family protein [Bacillota bacterium]|nr:GIY-YIG nuclease family protein [Bacillota bacterium]